MVRVLVTGATGFIGAKLAEGLVEHGDDVTCLVRSSSNLRALQPLGVRLAYGDIRDADAMRSVVKGYDVVYHVAGLLTAFRADELMQVNSRGFGNVAAACAASPNPPTLVSVSSLAAAGPAFADRARVETDPAKPVSNYGRAKRAAELIAEDFSADVPITIVRPPIVFGEGDPNMRRIFSPIWRWGVHVALGVGKCRYSLIHVRDLVDALILAAERGKRLLARRPGDSDSATGYYFVARDEQPTFAELGVLIANCLGRQSVRILRSSGPAFVWGAAAFSEVMSRLRGQPFIFNFDKAREARAGSWICSPRAICSDLGFATRAPLADQLRQTADWYRQQNLL